MRILREPVILTPMEPRRLAALLLLPLGLGCASRGPAALQDPRETGELVFWEVESASRPGGRAWLLGSVHAATRDLELDPAVERAFAAANALVIEADITALGADGRGFVQRTLQMATLPEGKTLDQLLTSPAWEQLSAFLRSRGHRPDDYRRFEPWLVMTVVTSYLFADAGLPAEGGVDLRFTSRAEGKLPIVALETPEFQLSLLDSLPLETQAGMLAAVLQRQTATRGDTLRLYDAWRLGDLAVIESQTVAGNGDRKVRDFHERVYVARNRNMAARIDALLAEERTWFVVVGAGHMVGAEGIPTLLARRGHKVSRIAKTPAAPPPASE